MNSLRDRTPSGGVKGVRNWSWSLTGILKYSVCVEVEKKNWGMGKTGVRRATRLRESPLGELQLYTFTLSLKNVPLLGGVSSYRPEYILPPSSGNPSRADRLPCCPIASDQAFEREFNAEKLQNLPIDVTLLQLPSDTFSKVNALFYPDFATRKGRNFCLESKGLRA